MTAIPAKYAGKFPRISHGGEVSVIFLLTDSTREETYHIEKIVIP